MFSVHVFLNKNKQQTHHQFAPINQLHAAISVMGILVFGERCKLC